MVDGGWWMVKSQLRPPLDDQAHDAINALLHRPDAERRRRRFRPGFAVRAKYARPQRRIDKTRRHHADVDAVAFQLQPQRLVQAVNGELTGSVKGIRWNPTLPGQAADGDQRAAACLDVRQGEMRRVERAEKVDAHHVLHRFEARTLEVCSHRYARRAEEHVEPAKALDGRRDGAADLGGIGHIGRKRHRLCAGGLRGADDFGEGFLIAGGDGDARPVSGKAQGGRPADSRGTAGNKHDFLGQRVHLQIVPVVVPGFAGFLTTRLSSSPSPA